MWVNRTRSRPRLVHLSSELTCLFRTSYLHRNLKGSSLLWVPPRPPPPRLPPPLRSQQGRGPYSLAGVCVPVPSFSLFSVSFVPHASFRIFLQVTLASIWEKTGCKPTVLIWEGNLGPASKGNIDVVVLSDGHWHCQQLTLAQASRSGPLHPFCDYVCVWIHIEDINPPRILSHILSNNYQWPLKIFKQDALPFIPIYNKI